MAMLAIEAPVWLRADSPASELFPAPAADDPLVSFLGSSAETASNSQRIQKQLADTAGRLSRALPLYLAEQLAFTTAARVQALVPWMVAETNGFVLSGGPWSDDAAADYARQAEGKGDYVVTIHLQTQAEPWMAELRLVRTIDAKRLTEFRAEFSPLSPEKALPGIASRLFASIRAETEAQPVVPPPLYRIPDAAQLADYLLRLEQLLAVRCAAMDGVSRGFLSGEREIIDGNIRLCLESGKSVPARILLAETLGTMKRVRPDIMPEFREKVALLQKAMLLPEPAQSVVQRIIREALAE
jgi:hypothetical protein